MMQAKLQGQQQRDLAELVLGHPLHARAHNICLSSLHLSMYTFLHLSMYTDLAGRGAFVRGSCSGGFVHSGMWGTFFV